MEGIRTNFEQSILGLIKKGLKPKVIAKELQIGKSNVSYYLAKLIKKGIVRKNGLIYEVNLINEFKNLSKATSSQPEIRGHAFMWKVQVDRLRNLDWKKLLDSKQINYDELGLKATPRIILNDRKIWLGKKNIIIYEPKDCSFFGENAIESRKLAVYSLLSILGQLENLLGVKLEHFRFTTAREHYSLIKNVLAIQCNKNREKINVYNEKGQWMCIDDSFNLGELETLGSQENKPFDTNLQVQKWWNENKETNFEVSPKFVLNSISQLSNLLAQSQSQLLQYRKENASHLALIKEYRKENISWRKDQTKQMNKIIEFNAKHQKTLGDFQ